MPKPNRSWTGLFVLLALAMGVQTPQYAGSLPQISRRPCCELL
jgi:hypothetical protein